MPDPTQHTPAGKRRRARGSSRQRLFDGPAYKRAQRTLDDVVERLRRLGYGTTIRADLSRDGRIFGGNYAVELSTAKPVLPATHGLTARGRGVVRLQGVAFRAHRGDEAGQRLAERLQADVELVARLEQVHFERIRVDPDGRPVIRHMGASVVWILFPPLVKTVPLVDEQLRATIAALEAFGTAPR